MDLQNAADLIWRQAATRPDALALHDRDREWTYGELQQAICGTAAYLAERGVREGQHVLVVLPTSAQFVMVYYALLAMGATAVTVNPACAPRELDYFIADGQCRFAIGWADTAAALRKATEAAGIDRLELGPDDLPQPGPMIEPAAGIDAAAVLLYTSGTTGQPKGAVLTHRNLLSCGDNLARALGSRPDDRMATALPLFHVFGQASVMSAAYSAGGALFLVHPFDAAGILELAARHRLTGIAGVPTMWNAMLHAQTDLTAADLTELRMTCSGGAALPLEVATAFRERFGAVVLDGYGLSETTGAATFNSPDTTGKELSVGRALPDVDLAIMDEHRRPLPPGEIGEVAVAGPVVMREYWNRPEATDAVRVGQWFLTGDMGRMDEDGDLWIVDRKKDLIIRGGYNVYPREVEEVLYAHPAIREVAVVGVPDERLGEEIAAIIAPGDDAHLDAAELRAWCGEQLADYKVPRIYHLVEQLPKGPTGKILKRGIDRDTLLARGERPARLGAPPPPAAAVTSNPIQPGEPDHD